MKKLVIGLIGPSKEKCTPEVYNFCMVLGKHLNEEGYRICCGGRGGAMEAVCKGAHQSANYRFGDTIGILPSDNKSDANEYADIVIPTGIGLARNIIVINSSDVVVAVAGGSGTLSELAFAWEKQKVVIACDQFEGWAKTLAGQSIDVSRNDQVISASTVQDIIDAIKKNRPPQ